MSVFSPVIEDQLCEKIEVLDTEKIIQQYKKEYKVDVSTYFQGKEVAIYRCPATGYRFYHPKELMARGDFYEHLEKLSEGVYYPKKWEHYQATKFIQPEDRVMEIGCGNGNFFEVCLEKGIRNLNGLELNTRSVAELQSKGFAVYNSTVEEFIEQHPGEKFNVVCSFQVLEHIYDVRSFFKSSFSLLEENGLLIIAVPNNNPYFLKYDKYHTLNLPPHHVGLWSENSLKQMGKVFNAEVVSYQTEPLQQRMEWVRVQKQHLISRKPGFKWLNLVPRPLYKLIMRLFIHRIEGSYSFIVYRKTSGLWH